MKRSACVAVLACALLASAGALAAAADAPPGYVLWSLDAKTTVASEQSTFVLDSASDVVLARSRHDKVAIGTAGGLVVENADGSQPVSLSPVAAIDAAFSPDGASIAFTTYGCQNGAPGGCTAVYVAGVDGSSTRLVARDASSPAWSPDGRTMAYVADVDSEGRGRLLIQPAGTGPAADLAAARASPPAFSPDGRRIAYGCGDGECIRDLRAKRVVDLRKLTKLPVTPSRYTLWSPNGRYLAINTAEDSDLGLAVVDLRTGTTRVLSGVRWLFEFAAPLAWSPDSTTLLWGYRYSRVRVFETNVRTGRRVRVSHDDRQWYFARWTRNGLTYLTYTGPFQPPY